MNNQNKETKTTLLVLNIIELLLFIITLALHLTFYSWSPLYEPLGYQLFYFFLLIPSHLLIGVYLFIYDNTKELSITNKIIPFIASLYQSLVFVLPKYLSSYTITNLLSLIAIIILIIFIFTFLNFIKQLKYQKRKTKNNE